ncbi:MAG: RNA polymerase sigma factor [Planctomycetaceae bacterium]
MTRPYPSDEQLDAWVLQTSQRALGYAMTLTHSHEDAEDIVHDCYSRLLAKIDQYDLVRDGTKLLFRSITNACINLSQRRRPESSLSQLGLDSGQNRHALTDHRMDQPVQRVLLHELEQAVAAAMSELPVTQRAAIELRSMGHSLMEVAEMLEISQANARVVLYRARTALAVKLQPFIEIEKP